MVTEHGLRPRDVLPVLCQTHEQLNAVLLYVWSVFGVSKGRGPDGNVRHTAINVFNILTRATRTL